MLETHLTQSTKKSHPEQFNLFGEPSILTEGIKYTGSKLKLLPYILTVVRSLPVKRIFDSVTRGWINYSHNPVLVKLFTQALVSSKEGHQSALKKITQDIVRLKQESK